MNVGARSIRKKRTSDIDYQKIAEQEQERFEKLPKEEQDKIIQEQKEAAAKASKKARNYVIAYFVGLATIALVILFATGVLP